MIDNTCCPIATTILPTSCSRWPATGNRRDDERHTGVCPHCGTELAIAVSVRATIARAPKALLDVNPHSEFFIQAQIPASPTIGGAPGAIVPPSSSASASIDDNSTRCDPHRVRMVRSRPERIR